MTRQALQNFCKKLHYSHMAVCFGLENKLYLILSHDAQGISQPPELSAK